MHKLKFSSPWFFYSDTEILFFDNRRLFTYNLVNYKKNEIHINKSHFPEYFRYTTHVGLYKNSIFYITKKENVISRVLLGPKEMQYKYRFKKGFYYHNSSVSLPIRLDSTSSDVLSNTLSSKYFPVHLNKKTNSDTSLQKLLIFDLDTGQPIWENRQFENFFDKTRINFIAYSHYIVIIIKNPYIFDYIPILVVDNTTGKFIHALSLKSGGEYIKKTGIKNGMLFLDFDRAIIEIDILKGKKIFSAGATKISLDSAFYDIEKIFGTLPK